MIFYKLEKHLQWRWKNVPVNMADLMRLHKVTNCWVEFVLNWKNFHHTDCKLLFTVCSFIRFSNMSGGSKVLFFIKHQLGALASARHCCRHYRNRMFFDNEINWRFFWLGFIMKSFICSSIFIEIIELISLCLFSITILQIDNTDSCHSAILMDILCWFREIIISLFRMQQWNIFTQSYRVCDK